MSRRRRDFEPDEVLDLERMFRGMGPTVRNLGRRLGGGVTWLIVGLVVVVAIWLATGIYQVSPGETAVIRRFGKELGKAGPGLHYRLPWPVDRTDVIKTAEVKRMELGRTPEGDIYPLESRMVTGDENLVDVQIIVQYRVEDPSAYLFRVWDPEGNPDKRTLRDASEVALRQVVGRRPIDDVLTVAKSDVQREAMIMLQQLMTDYESGILITEVKLQAVEVPEEVQASFKDVVSAKEDRERLINQAQGYEEDIIPKARGEAQKMLREAEAYREQKVKQSEGDADRFLSVLAEYEKAKDVTRKRLYLEAMEEVLPGIKKFIISPEAGNGLLQFLPLEATGISTAPEVEIPEEKEKEGGEE